MKKLASLFLVGALGCAALGLAPDHTEMFKHPSGDKADAPYQTSFAAPHGGYLFPFREMVMEVTIARDSNLRVYAYDLAGNPVILDEAMTRAQLKASAPGFSEAFTVDLSRETPNSFFGRISAPNLPAIERAIALRFAFALFDPRQNFTQQQCHGGHWASATPRLQEGGLSSR